MHLDYFLFSFLEPKWRKNLKKRKKNSPISEEMGCFLVRRKGLEPPTYWFVAWFCPCLFILKQTET